MEIFTHSPFLVPSLLATSFSSASAPCSTLTSTIHCHMMGHLFLIPFIGFSDETFVISRLCLVCAERNGEVLVKRVIDMRELKVLISCFGFSSLSSEDIIKSTGHRGRDEAVVNGVAEKEIFVSILSTLLCWRAAHDIVAGRHRLIHVFSGRCSKICIIWYLARTDMMRLAPHPAPLLDPPPILLLDPPLVILLGLSQEFSQVVFPFSVRGVLGERSTNIHVLEQGRHD
ncbi:hypothetical protein Tco_1211191 [Tanacetum coccineum]